jgi:hypothetical protein
MRERHPELPDAIKAFLDKVASLGAYPEFRRSLNLKWDPPNGNTINLGYVMRNGEFWTDVTRWSAGDPSVAQTYVEDLAILFNGDYVLRDSGSAYVQFNGHAPRMEELIGLLDSWYEAIERFQNRIREYIAEEERDE